MYINCRRVVCILSLNTTSLLTCGMEVGAILSSIFACTVALSPETRTPASYPSGTGRPASSSLIRYANPNQSNLKCNQIECSFHFVLLKDTGDDFSSFDFVDEHHILYAISNEDSIYVYDVRRDQQQWRQQPHKEKGKEMRLVRFQLALPPINRATTT